jgi:hypothetical protein
MDEDKVYCENCGICQDDVEIEFTLENPSNGENVDEGYNYYCYDCASQFT